VSPVARWRIAFLGLTGLVIGMEIWASADGNPDTRPWTDEIVSTIPGEVTALAIAGLCGWLSVHFAVRYIRKARARRADPPVE
jgi:hypothetical protein